jgi:hypothetical protein
VSIEDFLSPERLAGYRLTSADAPGLILKRYLWNVELSAAFYGPLHLFEIGLRNAVDRSFRLAYGDDWLTRPGVLAPKEVGLVSNALDELAKWGMPQARGKIIAELMLGFWARLFAKHYEVGSWSRGHVYFWPSRSEEIFPHAPKNMRTRKAMSARIEAIKKFRNRVFHHEPIWQRNDLVRIHNEICETARWITPDADSLISLSRVNEVLAKKP